MQAQDILDQVRYTLLDTGKTGWTDDELLSYLNSSMLQLVAFKPDAIPIIDVMALEVGSMQTLPDDAVVLMTAMFAFANTSIYVQDFREFTLVHADWAHEPAGRTQVVLVDPRLPRNFFVYPQADSGRHIWISYGAKPTVATDLTTVLNVPDWYRTALWASVVGMAYAKNAIRQDMAKSAEFLAMAEKYITNYTAAERAIVAAPLPKRSPA